MKNYSIKCLLLLLLAFTTKNCLLGAELLHQVEVLVIGGGPAGYSAALYASRAGFNTCLVEGETASQIALSQQVENYPGLLSSISGQELINNMCSQALHFGTKVIPGSVINIDLAKRPFLAQLSNKEKVEAQSVILATGARPKWLNLSSEQSLIGYGISNCATCDGHFYKGKHVAVVGGGYTALEEALYLSQIASKVTLIHRSEDFRADPLLLAKIKANSKIEVMPHTTIVEIHGDKKSGVRSLSLKNKEGDLELAVSALFVAIGHIPTGDLFKEYLEIDAEGSVRTLQGGTKTSIPGVFAAGDLVDNKYRQAVVAAALGCMAALDAQEYLKKDQQGSELSN